MGDVLLKLLDVLLGGAVERWREKSALKKQFDALRRNVLFAGITNDIPVELHQLRAFLVENGFVEKPKIRAFFDKWLTNPCVVTGMKAVNAFTYDEIHQMERELRDLEP